MYHTVSEAESSPYVYNLVDQRDCYTSACCASNWDGIKTCQASSSTGRSHSNDLTIISDEPYQKVVHYEEHYTDEAVRSQVELEPPLEGNTIGMKYKFKGNKGSNYFQFYPILTTTPTYTLTGQVISDNNRITLPYILWIYDNWHMANGRYCDQSTVSGIMIRAPGDGDFDKTMVE